MGSSKGGPVAGAGPLSSMSESRERGAIVWKDRQTPTSRRFDDIYFSPENGLAETRHVFLDGTDLPAAWAGTKRFAIGETGFGTGLNFLAAWDLWRRAGPRDGLLHFVSVERYPLSAAALARAHSAFAPIAPLAARLREALGAPLPGMHRFHFESDRVHLTLLHGDGAAMFEYLDARMDAWFLDGFSPARNPELWSDAVFSQLARLSAPGARLATFTVAGAVRRGLTAAGFEVSRRPGFGRKRDMLVGRYAGSPAPRFAGRGWRRPPDPVTPPRRALIVGGGIAGASLAHALTRRGVEAVIADRSGRLGTGASGNPVGIIMPRLTVDRTPSGRFHLAAFAYAARLVPPPVWVGGAAGGVLQLASSVGEWLRHGRLARGDLAPEGLLPVGRREASDLVGLPVDRPGLFYTGAGAVHPAALVRHLAGAVPVIAADWPADAAMIGFDPDLIFMANGIGARTLPHGEGLGLRASLGQILHARGDTRASLPSLRRVVTFGSYACPDGAGGIVAGSTYTPLAEPDIDRDHGPSDARSAEIHQAIAAALPALSPALGMTPASSSTAARCAVRATTPDHLPLAGAMPDFQRLGAHADDLRHGRHTENGLEGAHLGGLQVLTGLGSRGLTTAPLLAEWQISTLFGEPSPLERDLHESLNPARFFVRAMRQKTR